MVDAQSAKPVVNPIDVLSSLRGLRLIDLSHPLHDDMPIYPGRVVRPFERIATVNLAEHGVNSGRIEIGEHHGTHLDAPVHFIDGGSTIDQIPVNDLVGEAIVIDIATEAEADPDYRLLPVDVDGWEAAHGTIPDRAFVLIRSGWARRWPDATAYVNADADGRLHHPACTPEAAQLLVDRAATGVGVDTLSVDNGAPSEVRSPSHKVLHGAGRYVLENLANLEALPARGILLVIGAIPIAEGTGASARVLAWIA